METTISHLSLKINFANKKFDYIEVLFSTLFRRTVIYSETFRAYCDYINTIYLAKSNEWIEAITSRRVYVLEIFSSRCFFFLSKRKATNIFTDSDCMCIVEITEGGPIDFRNCLSGWKINK